MKSIMSAAGVRSIGAPVVFICRDKNVSRIGLTAWFLVYKIGIALVKTRFLAGTVYFPS